MIKNLRLLPITIVIMSMVLGVKVVDFSLGVEASFASSSEPEKTAVDKEKTPLHDQEATVEDVTPVEIISAPTRKEIEYLQKLAKRRQELDRRSGELDVREKLLEAVEMRIVERTTSLKKIEATIEAALKKHDALERAQLESLVKIYSAMKPKEAAQIFNNLDDEVLISIVQNMKEKKMGAILAKMSLDKAKKLTVSLATSKNLPKIEG